MSRMLGKYCGPREPSKILTSDNEMLMVFTTDSSVQRKGFKARYTSGMTSISMCGQAVRSGRIVGWRLNSGKFLKLRKYP